jgi:DNA polymerase (family 10)
MAGMPRPNDEVAALLGEYAELISITGGDAFRARSYERAARAIKGFPADMDTLAPGELRQIPGVGKSVADKVAEYFSTGSIAAVEEIRARIPPGVREMIAIPALGPARAMQLHAELGIGSVAELAEAVKKGLLRDLKGFGPKSEERILRGIELLAQTGERVLLSTGLEVAEQTVAALSQVSGCVRCTYAGSARRMRETVGDIDILATIANPEAGAGAPVMSAFTALPDVAEVIASGPTKTTIRTARGLQVDLRVVPEDSWGAALQYFTGSQAHNVRVREIAVRLGLRLSEYGLFRVDTGERIAARTEEEIYRALGMEWIPPTLREDGGEVEAALRGELPRLVTEQDLRGDLHTHTDLTDGASSLADMVAQARKNGYEYYAITDHAPDLIMHRMTDEKMLAQREQVRALQEELNREPGQELDQTQGQGTPPPPTLLHGTELNIGPDGTVDWPASFLDGFDICVASVHSHFGQPRAEMTRRFAAAAENPHVNVIGHPLTRVIGRRDPVDVDLHELFKACARTGTALEINGSPHRRDLPDEHLRRAKEAGVKFAIDSDAHAVSELGRPRYGVGSAQRGWLTPDDVINTWPLARLRDFLRKGR